ncbi:MAG: pro-sigmaK processing inhibitor BofA family protein [Ruminococcus sp.]|nr:pro-sigmaK processing inhibitor BofA family protein [Ruminococcus sp.]
MIIIITIFITFIVFSFIHYASRSKKPFKRAILSILLGLFSLAAVDFLSSFTSVYIPITTLSVLTSAVGGLPGTALMVMLTML